MKTDEQNNTMSPEDQRIAIAQACGWTGPFQQEWIPDHGMEGESTYAFAGTDPDGERWPLPDYLGDLNASHEMEKALTPDQFHDYRGSLWKITTAHLSDKPAAWIKAADRAYLTATAAQRAEAFLRATWLWTEPPITPAHE